MTGPNTSGREPRTIAELTQPRCVLRYGIGACTASGGPKCYNTWSTCQDRENYDGSGSIAWRFTSDNTYPDDFGDFSDADNIKTNGIPCVEQVSTSGSRINPGANRDGESPFGVTGKLTVRVRDIPWDDHVGDFYVEDRTGYEAGKALPVRGGFWRLFNARNALLNDMTLSIYDGYHGQTLAEMRRRDYFLENIDGPSFDGSATLTGVDPLKVVNDKKTQYPPASDLELNVNISSSQTSGIQVFGSQTDLDRTLGNDGRKLLEIGGEVMAYTGYTDDGESLYTLTGVTRGVFGTADSHSAGDAMQRAAYFDKIKPWVLLEELLTYDTRIPSSYIPTADWEEEAGTYIPTTRFSRLLYKPEGVRTLAGQICQQALIYVWWAEYDREVKLLTIRPPSDAIATLTDADNNLDGLQVTARHEDRLTRVVVYYDKIDPLGDDDEENFRRKYTVIDTDTEGAGVTPIIKTIFAQWTDARTQAAQIAVRLLTRYKETPRFVKVRVDAKDREISVGALADVFSSYLLDTEGNIDTSRYQVISAEEIEAGHMYLLDMETYEYVGRFAVYMADGSPTYADATEEQRAQNVGGFYSNDDGEMPDGSEGYKYQ